MEESYAEDVASHSDPESCVDARKGVGEALTGACAGWAIEPRNQTDRGADAVHLGGKQHDRQRYRELSAGPARPKTPRTHRISMRENREVPWSPGLMVGPDASARPRP